MAERPQTSMSTGLLFVGSIALSWLLLYYGIQWYLAPGMDLKASLPSSNATRYLNAVSAVSYSRDGRAIYFGHTSISTYMYQSEWDLVRWEVASGKAITATQRARITSVAVSPTTGELAVATGWPRVDEIDSRMLTHVESGTLKILNGDDLSGVREKVVNGCPIVAKFSPTGDSLAVIVERGIYNSATLVLLDAATLQERLSIHFAYPGMGGSYGTYPLAFSPSGTHLAFLDCDGHQLSVRQVDLHGNDAGRCAFNHTVPWLEYTPDGASLAAGCILLDASTLQRRGECLAPSGFQTNIAFSPDGSLMAIAGSNHRGESSLTRGFAELWRFDRKERIAELRLLWGNTGITATAISPDASNFATGHCDGTVNVWVIPRDREVGRVVGGH